MNRNFHRIVFNATRGLRMVVQETARSIGRGTRKATRGGTGAAVSMVATLAALASSAPLHAQIHADPDAPGRQRATVLLAPNGVPLVDIQTPSAAGVSRNVYRQFDIDAKGVILNNSRTSVQTQLGGVVQGNPWLARGPARVIVNEVNSNDPTYLRGFVEVAGSRADVIVANPSGISVNGGGFINAYRATLTTGAPQYGASGSLEGYLVRGGTVSIGGAGLDASATDSLAILARAFELSATLHAADLEVVAGANRIDADLVGIVPIAGTGAAPAYAIDVAHLGGMYAGHIALVVNEAGVGARNAGTIQTAAGGYTLTGAGRLTLSASGRLENSGMIQAASDATIDAAGLANSGTVQSAASLRIATQGDLANHVDATGGTLEGARVELASAAGDIDNRGGTVRQTSAAALVVSAARLSNTQAGFVGAPPVAQSATTGAGAASGGSGSATAPTSSGSNDSSAGTGSSGGSGGSGGTGSSGSSGGADGDGGTGSTPAATPTVIAPGTLTAAGAVLNDGGRIHAGGDVTLRTPIVDNAGGVLRVATMAVSGPVFGNAGGTLHVTNTFAADVAGFDNAGGTLRAGTLAIATTGDLDNRGGTLASDGAARLGVGGRLDNARGTVSAVDALDATVAGAVDNTAGRLLGNAAVSVAAGVLDNTLGAVQSAAGATRLAVADRLLNDRGGIGAGTDLLVRAGSLANTGTMRAERDGTLAVANGLANGGGIVSGRDTTVTAGRLDGGAAGVLGAGVAVDGTLGSAGDLSVTTTGSLTTAGTLIAAGHIAARGSSVDLTGGKASGANVTLTATTDDVTTRRASVTTPGTLRVTANASSDRSLVNDAGTLNAGQLDLQVANLRNTNAGRIVQTGAEATAIAVTGTLDNTAGTIVGNGIDLSLSAGALSNADGHLQHAGTGTLSVAAGRYDGAGGELVTHGALVAKVANDFDQSGGTITTRQITIEAGSLRNAGGVITQTGSAATRIAVATDLDNAAGTIVSNGSDVTLSAGTFLNTAGTVQHAGSGTLEIGATRAFSGAKGRIASDGVLDAHGGDFALDGGATSAARVTLDAASLSNKAGSIVQTGAGITRIATTGALTNDGGTIATNATEVELAVGGTLFNRDGHLRHAGDGTLKVTAGRYDGAGGELVGNGALLARVAGGFDQDAGIASARQVTIEAGSLSNRSGEIVQTGADATRVAVTGTLDNDRGTIATNGTDASISADSLSSAGGRIQHAGTGTLSLAAGRYGGAGGEITSNGDWRADVTGAFDQDGGTSTARRITLTAGALSNRGGTIVQTGDAAGRIGLTGVNGALDNTRGVIASNGDLTLAAASLANRGGSVRTAGTASLDVTTTDLLDNADAGVVGAARDLTLRAGRLSNDAGSVTAVRDLGVRVSGSLSNVGGTLAANGGTSLAATTLDNTRGTVSAVKGDLAVTTTGLTTNVLGTLQAAGRTSLVDGGLANTQGKVTGHAVSVDTNGGALDNTLGTLAAATALDVTSGALTNDRGLVQSGGAMSVDTHGQALVNTNAAGHASGQGGIASAGTLVMNAGATDNTAGFIGAGGTLTAITGGFTNAAGGVVLGQADVAIATNGATWDNRGGRTLAVGDLKVDAGGGMVRNGGALVRSGGTTSLAAATVDNGATAGTDQGIEGRHVAIVATNLDNTTGAIRADGNVTITSAGRIGNANGLMSAGDTLALLDPNRADPTAKTLSVVNTNGQLLAGKSLVLDGATFSGDGTLASGRDLSIALTQDLVNDATVSAAGELNYATTGRLTNHGRLLAGRVLTVSGRDVENTASGVMRGDTTVVKATSTLTNHGLIDGRDTRIDAGALVNGPTGRIYGDRLSIAAGSVLNDTAADGGSAGTIAAREVLDIGAGSIVNRKGALVLSGGDLRIGGALDAERHATGSAAVLRNQAATIEALGNMTVNVATLENQAGGVSWTMKQAQTQALEFSVTPGGQRFKADEVFIGSPRNDFRSGAISWSLSAAGVPDTNSQDTSLQLLVPPPDYPAARFRAYYLKSPSRSRDLDVNSCTSSESGGVCSTETIPGAWYAPSDPIWTVFGITPPTRELPADHPYRLYPDLKAGQDGIYGVDEYGTQVLVKAFDHPVTQAEIDEGRAYFKAHEDLDAATAKFTTTVAGGMFADGNVAPSRFFEDYRIWQYTATTQTPVLDKTADPARIVAGGAMTLTVGGGTNDMGQILAGGDLSVLGGAIKDTSTEVQATGEGHGDLIHTYIRHHSIKSDKRTYEAEHFDEVIPPKTILLGVARQEGHTAVASSQAPASTANASVDPAVGSAGGVSSGGRTAAIIEVPVSVQAPSGGAGGTPRAAAATGVDVAANAAPPVQAAARADTAGATAAAMPTRTSSGASTPQPLVVRTTTPDATIPKASLFKTAPGPSAHHLVETDPAFADYRTWLSSDYLLNAMGHDPTLVTKRLGDGFYEQRLIREQVAQLTGYRLLEGFQDDTTEYQALMDAGRTFAQRFALTPGIALTAAQMAQLTSDIVWLVEQMVTLADGSTERVLVPQVYVRVKPGDIDGSGALLSGERLVMTTDPGRGDVVNTGTLAGRTLVSITADNIKNLGGRISSGGSVQANAKTDLDNLGGTIDAGNAVVLKAGRDIRIASTSQTATGAQSTSTQLDRLAGVYVTNPGGTLTVSADRDIALVGAILSNTGAGSSTLVKAGRDISLDTVKTSRSLDITQDERNHMRTAESAEVGTRIAGGSGKTSSVTVLAGGDIVGRQVTVQTGGLVAMHADGDIELEAGRTTAETDSATQRTKRKLLGGKTTTTTAETRYESLSQGSRIAGGIVSITANGAITGEGVKLTGDDGVLVQAGGPLDLHEARDVRSQSTQVGVTRSGIGVGTTGLPVPDRKGAIDTHATSSDTANATTIESGNGGALLRSGAGATLRGVAIDVAKNATVRGAAVSVTGALDLHTITDTHEEKKSNHGSVVTRSARGVDMHLTDTDARGETSLARSTIQAANVDIRAVDENGQRGELTLSGTTVRTPGTLTVEASRLLLAPVQLTQVDTSHTSEGRDLMWQRVQGEGGSDPTANYTQVYAGQIVQQLDGAQIETGAKDSIDALARQPGMGWVDQLRNDPALAGKVDWQRVDDAYKGWDYKKEGLTPEGAGIVTLVVAYFTAGAASSLSGTVGAAVGGGMTGTVVGGAVAAGFTTLMSQAALAIINNQGNLGHALHDLGSSANVHALLNAIAVGGALAAMNMDPNGLPTAEGGAQKFMTQLGQNLQAGLVKAVIGTAINGGSLEDSLKAGIKGAFIDTAAAQGASAIGDMSIGDEAVLNAFTNKVAHAIAGCATGAARTDKKAGCGAGAIGAAVGELAAEAYGRQNDTVQFASMMGGIAAVLAGADAQEANVASQAGANAAANNYLNHDQWNQFAKDMQACGKDPVCEATQRAKYAQISKSQDAKLAVCDSAGDCDTLKTEVAEGRVYQVELVKSGKLPDYVMGGFDLQQLGLKLSNQPAYREQVGRSVAAQLTCQLDQSACDIQSAKMALGLGIALAGGPAASYMLSSLPAIAAAAKMTASACAASPVLCANQAAVVVSDLLAGEALGGASLAGGAAGLQVLSKVEAETQALRLIAQRNATLSAKTDNAVLNRADALLYNDLAARAKIRPDTSMDAVYAAKTDRTILADNNFDMAHVLTGEINDRGKATGYHAEIAANGEARITPGAAVTQNANGTYEAPVQIWNGSKMEWINKPGQGSTFFPPSWSEARITYEVSEAFKTRSMLSTQKWRATTPSGIVIEGFTNAKRTTFYPTGNP